MRPLQFPPWLKGWRAVVVAAVALAALAVAGALMRLGLDGAGVRNGEAAEQAATITAQPFTVSLGLTGTVTPGDVVSVTAPFDARVAEVDVTLGESVHQGQALIRLDAADVEQRRRQAEAEYLKATQAAEDLRQWASGPEMAQARRTQNAAEVELADTQRKATETKSLFDRGLVARDEYDGALEQLRGQTMALEAAREEVKETAKRGGAANQRVAELELETARAQLATARNDSADAILRAPCEGIVVRPAGDHPEASGQSIHPGASLTRGQLIANIARPNGLAVSFELSEADANRIHPGQAVVVTGAGFPGLMLQGTITTVAREANPPSSGAGAGVTFSASARLDDVPLSQAAMIRIGMTANVSVVLYQNPSALTAPAAAIHGVAPDTFVMVKDRLSGTLRRRSVRIGQVSADTVEILSGLSPGETIVYSAAASQEAE